MVAAAADLDGVSILFGQDAYWDAHHKYGHNLLFGLLACGAMALASRRRLYGLVLYLVLFHLHLVMDYFGSGPGWPLYYLWPFSLRTILNRNAWEFYSWQNITAAFVFFIWTCMIAVRLGRTPLEMLMPNLDQQGVSALRRMGRRIGVRPLHDPTVFTVAPPEE